MKTHTVITASQAVALAKKILLKKYPKASFAFCAGSIMRGQGTPTSDIDLVVIFPRVKNPYRESFVFEGIPVEAFIHDKDTLAFFFQKDREELHAAIMDMVVNSVVVPARTALSTKIQTKAHKLLKNGPPRLTKEKKEILQYMITDAIDDLRGGLAKDERFFVGMRLLDKLAEATQLQSKQWIGFGKHAARQLRRTSPHFASSYKKAFDILLATNNPTPLIRLADKILEPIGGRLFDGHRQDAPRSFRLKKRRS